MNCRCGHDDDSDTPHPCHAKGYTCKKPAQRRFYNPKVVGIAGVQMKFGMSDTWACDDCWNSFKKTVQTTL